jgi:glycosyltransferase involved in cell wall biosynthesis
MSQTNRSLVSIVIINKDYGHFVGRAIESALNQTYHPVEVIIVDDGSTDKSLEVINGFANHKRVKVVRTNGVGASVARNEGIKCVQGSYVAFLDSDDYFLPEKIALQMEVCSKYPFPAVCTGVFLHSEIPAVEDTSSDPPARIDIQLFLKKPLGVGGYLMSTLLVSRETLKEIGGFDPRLRHGEDYDFASRLSRKTPFHNLKRPLTYIEIHDTSVSSRPGYQFSIDCKYWMSKFVFENYIVLTFSEITKYCIWGFWGLLKFALKSRNSKQIFVAFSSLSTLKFLFKKYRRF